MTVGKVNRLPNIRAIVNENGILTPESRITLDQLFELIPITGEGSPEGLVDARQGATYYDLSAGQGSRHYIKIKNSINGNQALGWELA